MMRYSDHLEKVRKLKEELTRLRSFPASGDQVINYLIESADGLLTAARILLEARMSDEQDNRKTGQGSPPV